MERSFHQPQRQSALGILVLFVDTLQQYARALWPIVVVWIFKFNELNKAYLAVGSLSIVLVIGLLAYLKFRNFTFYLDADSDEFIIHEGIFTKTKTVLQLHKIQQVNINQSVMQRLIGVYELDVDTAGSNKKEGVIRAISHPLALALKMRLLDNENRKPLEELTEDLEAKVIPTEIPFITISFLSLLKVGITSNYIRSLSLLLFFLITVFDYVQKITGEEVLNDENLAQYVNTSFMVSRFLVWMLLLFIAVLVINLVRIISKYYGYTIAKQRGSLLLSFGLLNTKSTIIKPEKVQITTITRNYFQKRMNILELKIKQASGGEKEQQKMAISIPGCNEQERNEILKLIFDTVPERGLILKPNYRKLVFSLVLAIVLPLTLFFLLGSYGSARVLDFTYLTPVYVLFVGLIVLFGFRNNRLFVGPDFIIKQSGAWDIDNEIIEPRKIQAITVSQLFWHKSANIGSITLHTAGGTIAFQLGNYTKIKEYANLWLYEIETSNSNWM